MLNHIKPNFKSFEIDCGKIRGFVYKGNLESEIKSKNLNKTKSLQIFENMLMIRELEEMIVKLRSGVYEPIIDYSYRGPTHVSIGQEASAVGVNTALRINDKITSTHRGHGDSMAKGTSAIFNMNYAELSARLNLNTNKKHKNLLEEVLEHHVYRTIAELFGKESGYCKGRGGSMHIADFSVGHLGANAIVGGGVPIATGAATGLRYLKNKEIVCCFAGDGAYANGVVLESLNWANQFQFTNYFAGENAFGLPIIFIIQNNHYGMTGRADNEVMGVKRLARRGVGFSENNMHAEVINGMDVLAVYEAIKRSSDKCKNGDGPVLLELDTYRYYGHSLSDPRNEYRKREEENDWKKIDPIDNFKMQLLQSNIITNKEIIKIETKVKVRNAKAAIKAANSKDPDVSDVLKYIYSDNTIVDIPKKFTEEHSKNNNFIKRDDDNIITYKDAIKEALYEEMLRDKRVIFFGEDVADYGGAFKATKGLLETFGRERVFNTPISEACICGSAVGASMVGLRPVAELMYMDFTLMSSDQISNQAAKWHYMSGAQIEIPIVIRASVGGGKGYGGQHSQSLESIFAHIPGLYILYPSTANDAKGMLKMAIRNNNPVLFCESQLLYGKKDYVPNEEYLIEVGQAKIVSEGNDLTIVTWGPALYDSIDAAKKLEENGKSVEVIDIRTIIPLDIETIIKSVKKTGRCIVTTHAVTIGSFASEIASQINEMAFDYLDHPVIRLGSLNGIAPQSTVLENEFLLNSNKIFEKANTLFK